MRLVPNLPPDAPRPLIAVTTSELRESKSATLTRHGEPPSHEMALGMKYLQAVEAAGGIPVVVPPMHDDAVAPLLERCSALLLSGGPDLDPDAYGARRHGRPGRPRRSSTTSSSPPRAPPTCAACRSSRSAAACR